MTRQNRQGSSYSLGRHSSGLGVADKVRSDVPSDASQSASDLDEVSQSGAGLLNLLTKGRYLGVLERRDGEYSSRKWRFEISLQLKVPQEGEWR